MPGPRILVRLPVRALSDLRGAARTVAELSVLLRDLRDEVAALREEVAGLHDELARMRLPRRRP